MIAEKLDAMVKLGLANSRMKDFYDVWTMVNQFQIKPEEVVPVIKDFKTGRLPIRYFTILAACRSWLLIAPIYCITVSLRMLCKSSGIS